MTYYVSPAGSDSNPGSEGAPFRTIQKAANTINPGDTVLVDDGVYTYSGPTDCFGKVITCIYRGSPPDHWLVFRSKNTSTAKIDGGNGSAASGYGCNRGAAYVRIQDFAIYGLANESGSAGGIDVFNGGSNSQIIGNNIHDIGHVCTDTGNGQNSIFIKGNNV